MKLSEIKPNPGNPRIIKDEKFRKLCKSLEEFPQMMELRPIVVDDQGIILGGNMRYRALKENGTREIPDAWVKRADELTEEQKREFVIKDNAGFGEWDWDVLANEWDDLPLDDWGLEVPDSIDDVDILGTGEALDGSNYGDKSSASNVPFTILSIGGLIDKDFARQVEAKLIDNGAIPGEDNGLIIQDVLKALFE